MARILLAFIRGYRYLLKPWWGNHCRFTPTCSEYAMQAIHRHGALGGSCLAFRRILRCHPWRPGGFDPVP
jgi:putative membrane protein insertion efficiency factor